MHRAARILVAVGADNRLAVIHAGLLGSRRSPALAAVIACALHFDGTNKHAFPRNHVSQFPS